jgi:hypothetical protein
MTEPPAGWTHLKALFDEVPSSLAPEMKPADPTLLAILRRRLAIRDRVEPRHLLDPDLDQSTRLGLLNAIAPECEVGAGRERGRWRLRDAPRRATLRELEPHGMLQVLDADRAPDDLVWQKLYRLYAGPRVSTDQLNSVELRSWLTVVEWIDSSPSTTPTFVPSADELRRLLARRLRSEDYDAQVGRAFVGREQELAALSSFLASAFNRSPTALLDHMFGTDAPSGCVGDEASRDARAAALVERWGA